MARELSNSATDICDDETHKRHLLAVEDNQSIAALADAAGGGAKGKAAKAGTRLDLVLFVLTFSVFYVAL